LSALEKKMTPTSASHRTLISRAAPAGSHVPLIPEHWFPAAYDDGEAVLRHLITTGLRDEHDVPMELSASFLMGDSVGDNIAHHVGQRWKMTTASTLPPPSDIGSSSRKSAALPQVQGRSREVHGATNAAEGSPVILKFLSPFSAHKL
jgi:hypothetical protein